MDTDQNKNLRHNNLFKGVLFDRIDFDKINFKEIALSEGKVLFREKDSTEEIFLIVSGQINLETSQEISDELPTSILLSTNDIFGYDELYESITRKSKATAVVRSEIISITGQDLNNLIVQDWAILDNLKANIHFPNNPNPANKSVKNADTNQNEFNIESELSDEISEKEFDRISAILKTEKEILSHSYEISCKRRSKYTKNSILYHINLIVL